VRQRVKPHVAEIRPYQPGKPIEELERELGITGAIKLASNENPIGPSPKALAAAREALGDVNRYPDAGAVVLRRRLATHLGVDVDPEEIVVGAGADEILGLIGQTYLGPGDEVVFGWPSFAMYPILAQVAGATAVAVPLTREFVYDLDAMIAAVTPRTRVVFLCNPNNPTGTTVGRDAFDRFATALPPDVILAVDEAYCEYARRPDFPQALGWVRRRPGTVVLRTFSKIYGLAGLRVGYGVADAETVSFLNRPRHPFNVSLVAQAAALAALDDEAHVSEARRVNETGLAYLGRELLSLGIDVWPSEANFVLARAGAGTHDALLREGVIVRPMAGFGLPDHVRITVGLPEENERLVKTLRRLREQPR
jgi:histidinol-phosphate aminotransferase